MERKKHGKNRKGCRSYMRYGERNKCINTLEDQKEAKVEQKSEYRMPDTKEQEKIRMR